MLAENARILVTGGAGFIGSHIAERLLHDGRRVRLLDNFSSGSRNTVARLEQTVRSLLEVVEGDLRDQEAVARAMREVTHVIHLAALPSVQRSVEDPITTNEVNITGTLNLLEAARKQRVERLIFAGSSSVYGDQQELPKREIMPPRPRSPYALTKLVGESYCTIYHDLFGLPTLTLRYFNVFGPRQNPDSPYAAVIPLFIRALLQGEPPRIFGDGHQTRDFTYIDNVVEANLLALTREGTGGAVMNVACGQRTSLLELLSLLQGILGQVTTPVHLPPRAGDVRDSQAAVEEAERRLGFRPHVELAEGLRRTVAWYQDAQGTR